MAEIPASKSRAETRLLSGLIYVFTSVIVVIQFFNSFFFSSFDKITGTRGDARYLLSVFEHWYNVVRGKSDWQSPNFFYPIEKTLGYSDALLGGGLIHSFFRMLGFDPFLSYELTLITFLLIGFAGTLWVCRKFLGLPPILAAIAAGLAVSINGLQFQAFHGQLLAFTWIPLLFGLFAAWIQAEGWRRILWLLGAVFTFIILLFTSFYAVWFSVSLLMAVLLIYAIGAILSRKFIVRDLLQFAVSRVPDAIIAGVLLGIAALIFVDLYAEAREVAAKTGGFGWTRAVNSLPSLGDVFYIERFNWLYNDVFTWFDTDPSNYSRLNGLSTGYTPGFLLAFFASVFGLIYIYFVRRNADVTIVRAFVFSIAVLAISLTLYRVMEFSLWALPYKLVPGAEAIRGPSRFNLVLGQFMALVIVFMAAYAIRNFRKTWFMFAIWSFLGFICLEQINTTQFSYSRKGELAFLTKAQPPEECRLIALIDTDSLSRQDRVVHISANLVSSVYDIPTPMGHSGVFPEKYGHIMYPLKDQFFDGLISWVEIFDLNDEVPFCVFDITAENWQVYTGFDHLISSETSGLEIVQRIDFAAPDFNEGLLVGKWSRQHKWGRWSEGNDSGLQFAFPDNRPRVLEFRLGALISGQVPEMRVSVIVNDETSEAWRFRFPGGVGARPELAVSRQIRLTSDMYDDANAVRIMFEVRDPRTPADLGRNANNTRELGVSLYSVDVMELP